MGFFVIGPDERCEAQNLVAQHSSHALMPVQFQTQHHGAPGKSEGPFLEIPGSHSLSLFTLLSWGTAGPDRTDCTRCVAAKNDDSFKLKWYIFLQPKIVVTVWNFTS